MIGLIGKAKGTITDSIERSIVANFSAANLVASTSLNFANQGFTLNANFVDQLSQLTETRINLQNDINGNPGVSSSYRNRGVELAWRYEQLEVSMGGSGTREYTQDQINELLETGRVRGMEGQHINSAASHPELQGNPDNIKFLTRDEHFAEHGGDWRNQTSGELLDRESKLEGLNRKQLFQNDVAGLGISAAIGFGSGFVISTIMEMAKTGAYSKEVFKHSWIAGFESASISSVTYVGGRAAVALIKAANSDFAQTAMGQTISVGAAGILSVAIVSAYQYAKMRFNGVDKNDAFDVIGKQMTVSLVNLSLSAVATGAWGGVAGVCVSVGATIVYVSANIAKTVRERAFNDRLREYTVEQYKPIYI